MSFSGKNHLQTSTWGRFVLGMFVLAWLNIAAQPCLMAMEMVPEVSLASEHAAPAGHIGHMADATESTHCGHCPPGAERHAALCETGSAAGCEIFPGYNVDGRQFKLKLKDVPLQLTLPIVENTLEFATPVMSLPLHDNKRLRFAGDPPLNIRHCVFLI